MNFKKFFYILLLQFPLANLGRIELGRGVNFTNNDIAVFLFISLFIFNKIYMHEKIVFPKLFNNIQTFIFIAFISLLIGNRNITIHKTIISGLYLVRFIVYSLIFVAVYNLNIENKIKEKQIHKILLIIGFVI